MGIAPEPFHRQYGLRLPVDIFRGAIVLMLSRYFLDLMFGTPTVMNNFSSKREFGVWNFLRTVTPFLVSSSRSTSSSLRRQLPKKWVILVLARSHAFVVRPAAARSHSPVDCKLLTFGAYEEVLISDEIGMDLCLHVELTEAVTSSSRHRRLIQRTCPERHRPSARLQTRSCGFSVQN